MLGALVGNVLGRQDGFDVWLAKKKKDSYPPVGTAVGDSDGEQLGHCDVGIMLGALVGNALGVDIGVALGALVGNVLGRQDGSVVWIAEGELDSHAGGTAF
jgi:hypothetical protein